MTTWTKVKLGAGVILVLTVGIALLIHFSGRSASRFLGEGLAQELEVKEMDKFISISFDKRGGATVKDVTYLAKDGYVYTQEFKDASPMEGMIRWVPYNESSSMFQSRSVSRWFGSAVDLNLPENCARVLGVDIGYDGAGERSKNLTCKMNDGTIKSREYLEGMVDRHFGGWLEITTD